jgi:hypothetical protein
MELNLVFLGVDFSADSTHPRARLRLAADEATLPTHMAVPRVEISIPLTNAHLALPIAAIASQTRQAARQFVNQQAIEDWVMQAPQP